MKTYVYQLNIFCFFLITLSLSAQKKQEKPQSQINIIAQYISQSNEVELRFFSDKKSVLENGIKNGFIVERVELTNPPKVDKVEDLDFTKLSVTASFNEQEWQNAIRNASEKQKKDLILAKDFYDAIGTEKGGQFSLDKGIKDLKEEKGKEDFEYMVFGLTAIKNSIVARGLGVSYTDKNVQPGKTYLYRIRIAKPDKIYQVHPGYYSITTNPENQDIRRKIYVKPGDSELSFMWEEKDMVSGAVIERKDNKTGKWIVITKAPVYPVGKTVRNGFNDKNLKNYVTYEYRFYGFTPFGKKVLFGTAKGIPRDLTPPKKPVLISAKHTKPNEITIRWDLNKPIDNDLKGFLIARGESNQGKYKVLNKRILSKNKRSYIDKSFSRHKTNYYIVQAIDTAGNVSSTIPAFVTIIDSIPPVKPKFLSGKIDTTGVVTIKIKLNKEKDLMGYRLYRANSDKHEFSVIQEGFDDNDSIPKPVKTVFKDTVTLNSLTPYIYYKVIALDKNFNQSPFSDILKVKRPDTIPPVTPVFKQVKVGKKEVTFKFTKSQGEDVANYYIYRKTSYNEPWKEVQVLPNNQVKYTDRKVKQGHKYYYTVRSKDLSGNWSDYAVPILAKPYDDGVRPVVKNLKFIKNKEKNTIKLTWEYPSDYKDVYFVIYKTDKKGHLKQYKGISKMNFSEQATKTDYAIKAFTKDGGESKLSKIIKIN